MNDRGKKEEIKLQFNLKSLQRRLVVLRNGRHVPLSEIADEAGVHHNTVYRLASGKHHTADLQTLGLLLKYFRGQGMDIDISDLIVEIELEAEKNDKTPSNS